ncbi:MAG: thiol:disulfide interchange protein DsbG [Gammaproteobacteria bacterium]
MKAFVWLLAAVSLCACANPPANQPVEATASPAAASAVQKAVAAEGLQINGSLDAPAGYRGYLAAYRGQELPVYALPDGQHVVIGTLFDINGRNLTADAMQKIASAAFGPTQWRALAQSTWVVEGNPQAKRIVYAFVDTRCPYCRQLWEQSQPWLKQGDVQMRNILVAVIAPESLPEAAAVLAAKDPAEAWNRNEKDFGKDPALTKDSPSAAIKKVNANTTLMNQLGFVGTPAIVWKDARGQIHVLQGLPRDPQELAAVFQG